MSRQAYRTVDYGGKGAPYVAFIAYAVSIRPEYCIKVRYVTLIKQRAARLVLLTALVISAARHFSIPFYPKILFTNEKFSPQRT